MHVNIEFGLNCDVEDNNLIILATSKSSRFDIIYLECFTLFRSHSFNLNSAPYNT